MKTLRFKTNQIEVIKKLNDIVSKSPTPDIAIFKLLNVPFFYISNRIFAFGIKIPIEDYDPEEEKTNFTIADFGKKEIQLEKNQDDNFLETIRLRIEEILSQKREHFLLLNLKEKWNPNGTMIISPLTEAIWKIHITNGAKVSVEWIDLAIKIGKKLNCKELYCCLTEKELDPILFLPISPLLALPISSPSNELPEWFFIVMPLNI